MEDAKIIQLYQARSQQAIAETETKYGSYCYSISYNILASREDAQEAVNDTYLAAWNAIPPKVPRILSAFLGRITRNLSLDRWRASHAAKRGGGQVPLALEELSQCTCGGTQPEEAIQARELIAAINHFLDSLPTQERRVFLARYWYLFSARQIGEAMGYSESKVNAILHRLRGRLKKRLEQEGLV